MWRKEQKESLIYLMETEIGGNACSGGNGGNNVVFFVVFLGFKIDLQNVECLLIFIPFF